MAVKLITEAAFDAEFMKDLDNKWVEISNNYMKNKYGGMTNKISTTNDSKFDAEQSEVGKLIIDEVTKMLKAQEFKTPEVSYSEDIKDAQTAINSTISYFNDLDVDQPDMYNGVIRSYKVIKSNLRLDNPGTKASEFKNWVDGYYRINLNIVVFVRSVLYDHNPLNNKYNFSSRHNIDKFKFYIGSNVMSLPFENYRKLYNSIIKKASEIIKKNKQAAYWDLEEEDLFYLKDDVEYLGKLKKEED